MPERISLREASERLGLHYMTVYRYVRTGRLRARKNGDEWEVDVTDLAAVRGERRRSSGRRGDPARRARVPDLTERLVQGDEPGAWMLVQAALAGGASPQAVYTDLFIPALRLVGDRWERGQIDVVDEHRATAVMQRLIGRMGPLFRRAGRTRALVVVGAPEGELHGLPAALVADLLRAESFDVVDLGANVPTPSFVECVRLLPPASLVGVVVTASGRLPAARRLVKALQSAREDVTFIVGGAAVTQAEADRIGADIWAPDAEALVRAVSHKPTQPAASGRG